MMSIPAASAGDVWKERFAFTSGSTLLWGFLLLKLQPFAASYQTGSHIHFWTSWWSREGVGTPNYWIYVALVYGLTLGFWTVFLAILHVISQGLWMLLPDGNQNTNAAHIKRRLSSISQGTYILVFVLNAIIVYAIVFGVGTLVISAIFVRPLLISWLHLSAGWAGYIGSVIAVSLVSFLATLLTFIYFRKRKSLTFSFKDWLTWRRVLFILIGFAFFCISLATVTEITSTVDLNVNKKVFYQSQDQTVDLYIKLGGSASSPGYADLSLLSLPGGETRRLTLQDLGEGQYFSYVPLKELDTGIYQIDLTYPHSSWSLSYPFLQSQTRRSARVLIIK